MIELTATLARFLSLLALVTVVFMLRRIENGQGKEEFIPLLREMCGHMSKAYCAFASGAAASGASPDAETDAGGSVLALALASLIAAGS